MPQLMFRCPYTNKPIQSGIELVSENLKSVSKFPISVQCPHCGKQHHGTIADVSRQLALLGFQINEVRVHRMVPKSRTDLLFINCVLHRRF